MSETPKLLDPQAMPESSSETLKTAGQLLKAARLRAGVHLAVLSVTLKIPVRQLEALEADQYQLGQSPVFVRSLAASVCRQLRTDPAPILALLPHAGTYLEPNGAVRQAYVRPADFGRMGGSSPKLPMRAWWAAAGMLVMIAALIWLPNPSQWSWLEDATARWMTTAPEPRAVASESNAQGLSSSTEAAPLGAISEVPTISTPAASSPAVAAGSDTSVAISPTPILQFAAIQSSWVEVRDAKKQMVWSGVLKAGEMGQVPVSQSLDVAIGRAEAVQVTFKGQAFDLKPYTKVNVARFEVKP